jgi:hypothetical protein
MGKRAVSRYFTEAHVKNKISICGINVLNPLNFGFRILWCELRCAHLDVPVEKQTRHKRGRVFCWTFLEFFASSKYFFDHSQLSQYF